MSDSLEQRRKALEDSYFQKMEEEAIKRLGERQNAGQERKSPITGKPMEQINISGIVVDRCVDSGGIFLDAGELAEIIKASMQAEAENSGWLGGFLKKLKS